MIRAALLTSGQLGSYDVFKNNLLVEKLRFGRDDVGTHLSASLLASLVATTVCNAPDVVKTRMMNSSSSMTFTECVSGIVKNEGLSALMKGWTASYCRIGPHTVISFLMIEQIRRFIGMATY